MRVRHLGSIAMTAAALLSFAPPALATFPGANGRIAYAFTASHSTSPNGIYTVRPDGSDLRHIGPIGAHSPSWSADGERLVFVQRTDGRQLIYTMSATGDNVTWVADVGFGVQLYPSPSFAPGGDRIVYSSGNSIRSVAADGTDPRRILATRNVAKKQRCCLYDPRYSPDGQRIVFAWGPDRNRKAGIWLMRSDGTHVRRLTRPEDHLDSGPDYSPDGRLIVFARSQSGEGLWVVRPDGTGERRIPSGLIDLSPVWSPAQDQLAAATFYYVPSSLLKGTQCADVFAGPAFGVDRHYLTANCDGKTIETYAYDPSWQPLAAGSTG